MSAQTFAKLLSSEAELSSYLKYVRTRPPAPPIPPSHSKYSTGPFRETSHKERKPSSLVRPYVEEYLRLIKEAMGVENYSGRKIITRMLQYLEEFPSMGYLVEVINSFGKEKKKLCTSEPAIMLHAHDEMVPLFQKVIEKVESLKKEAESKKLMELGQRIVHLQRLVQTTQKHPLAEDSPLQLMEPERVEKYLVMEENISRAEQNYGKFSQCFHKNQEVFSNINKVYQSIGKNIHQPN